MLLIAFLLFGSLVGCWLAAPMKGQDMTSPRAERQPDRPPCFGGHEWDEWLRLNRLSGSGRAASACCDCTPEFMGEMLDEGKCTGGPPCASCTGSRISAMCRV